MSLSALNWRRLPTQVLGASTAVAVLDAIYTALGPGGVTYYDGSTRTPGSGSAGTWTRYQNAGTTEALYCTPATTTLTNRILIAGVNAVRTPLMASPDTYSSNMLMATIVKNAGAFASWDHATQPFTSGSPFGFWRFLSIAAITLGNVYCFEAEEAVAVFVENGADGSIFGFVAGAILDPESSDVTSDAESDGKLYGLLVTGSTAIGNTFNTAGGTTASTNAFMAHSTTAAQAHIGCFTPGAGTIKTLFRVLTPALSTTTHLKTPAGRFVRIPYLFADRSGNSPIVGRLREIVNGPDGKIINVYQESGVDVAYLVSGSSTADQDAVWLLA